MSAAYSLGATLVLLIGSHNLDGLQLLTQWEEAFNYPSGSKLGLLGAIQNIGSLAACPFTPYFADGLGRKRTIFFGAVIMIAGTIIQTASQSVNMFIGSRFMCMFSQFRTHAKTINYILDFLSGIRPWILFQCCADVGDGTCISVGCHKTLG